MLLHHRVSDRSSGRSLCCLVLFARPPPPSPLHFHTSSLQYAESKRHKLSPCLNQRHGRQHLDISYTHLIYPRHLLPPFSKRANFTVMGGKINANVQAEKATWFGCGNHIPSVRMSSLVLLLCPSFEGFLLSAFPTTCLCCSDHEPIHLSPYLSQDCLNIHDSSHPFRSTTHPISSLIPFPFPSSTITT